jgi:regulator of protease activity HflC (stomatin/prohibitin superfamily)
MSACDDVCLCEQMKNEAEARRQQYILEGEGEAQAIRLRAQVLLRQTGLGPS